MAMDPWVVKTGLFQAHYNLTYYQCAHVIISENQNSLQHVVDTYFNTYTEAIMRTYLDSVRH